MESVCLDTGVLIEYFRKKEKKNTFLYRLAAYFGFKVSAITKYEFERGLKQEDAFWEAFFAQTEILPFDSECAKIASSIYQKLKKENKLISADDILIAATAISNELPLATFNVDHFERVDGLKLIRSTDSFEN